MPNDRANLVGGLPFPDVNDRRRAARALGVSATALTPKQRMSESQHQQQLFTWLNFWTRCVPQFARTYHVANEFNGDVVTKNTKRGVVTYSPGAVKRKAEGVKVGILDLANHAMSAEFSGLFIDLKVRDAQLSDDKTAPWDQRRELLWLRDQQKSAHVVWSWAEAAALHVWYFDVQRPTSLLASIGELDVWLVPKFGGHDERCGCGVNLQTEVSKRVQ